MNYALIDQSVIATLKEISSDDPTFIEELSALYLKQYQEKSLEIPLLVMSGEYKKVAAIVHTIKSSSGNLGATNFYGLCTKFEQLAIAGNGPELVAHLPVFEESYAKVAAEILKLASTKAA